MLTRLRARVSSAHVIAVIALFFAVAGGSAIALQGKNSVDSGDIRKNAVKSSDIAKNAVKSADIAKNAVKSPDIAANAVNSAKIQDGGVGTVDLVADEAVHKVGAPGEPAFGNGGQGDCLWGNANSIIPGFGNPAGFYKDKNGRVHLVGHVVAQDGSGGDATCNNEPPSFQDNVIFTLPEGYRPANLELQDGSFWSNEGDLPSDPNQTVVIGPTTNLTIPPSSTIAAGALLAQSPDEQSFSLDGISFRAAGPGTGLPRRTAAAGGVTGSAGGGLLPDLP